MAHDVARQRVDRNGVFMMRSLAVALLCGALVACKSPPMATDGAPPVADAAPSFAPPDDCVETLNGVAIASGPCDSGTLAHHYGAAPTGNGFAHITGGLQDPAAYTIQSSDLTTALTSSPPITGTTFSGNGVTLDGGLVLGAGGSSGIVAGNGSNVRWACDSPYATSLSAAGWVTAYTYWPSTLTGARDHFNVTFDATQYGDAGGPIYDNVIDGVLAYVYAANSVDGGATVWQMGLTPSNSASLTFQPTLVTLGCTSTTATTGCTNYASNAPTNPVSTEYQAIVVDGGGLALQWAYAYDSGTYPYFQAVVTPCHDKRTQPAP